MRVTDPRRLARRRLQAFARQVPLAVAGDIEGVHQARVASRRLRELLPLFAVTPRCAPVARTLRTHVRRLTRVLGPVREIDVSVMTLDQVTAQHPGLEAAAAAVRDALEGQRVTASARMIDTLASADLDDLSTRTFRLATDLVAPAVRWRMAATLAARIGARWRGVRAALSAAGALYAPDRIHRVRIALKKFRYALELAEDVGRLRLRGTIDRLKSLQDVLGLLHDLEVLAASVRDCGSDATESAAQAALADLARALDDEIRQHHSRFLSARRSLTMVFHWARHAQVRLRRKARSGPPRPHPPRRRRSMRRIDAGQRS